jgi:hypothetical protein
MAAPPKDASHITSTNLYGVDSMGKNIFFGFSTADGPSDFLTTHENLGAIIHYLQKIANEAQQQRTRTSPETADLEVRESTSNPVLSLAVDSDVTGSSAELVCTRRDGTQIEAQLGADLLEGLLQKLPQVIEKMKQRRAAHQRPN